MKSWGKAVASGNAPFKFAPANGTNFFRDFGWEERAFHSTMEEAERLDRNEDDVALEVSGSLLSGAYARGVSSHVGHRGARAVLMDVRERTRRIPLHERRANLVRVAIQPK